MANDNGKVRTKWVLRMRLDLDLGPRFVLVEREFWDGDPLHGVRRETIRADVSSMDEAELRASALGVDWSLVSREDLLQ